MKLENNIFMKKVYLQLKALTERDNADMQMVARYLGNDEFSDSYLLDMACDAKCPDVFNVVSEILSSGDKKLEVITREKYEQLRAKVCESAKKHHTKQDRNMNL